MASANLSFVFSNASRSTVLQTSNWYASSKFIRSNAVELGRASFEEEGCSSWKMPGVDPVEGEGVAEGGMGSRFPRRGVMQHVK